MCLGLVLTEVFVTRWQVTGSHRRNEPAWTAAVSARTLEHFGGLCIRARRILCQKLAPTCMVAIARNPDVLAEVIAFVLSDGATEFEVEYKDGEDHVVAFSGTVGVGVTAFRSDSDDA